MLNLFHNNFYQDSFYRSGSDPVVEVIDFSSEAAQEYDPSALEGAQVDAGDAPAPQTDTEKFRDMVDKFAHRLLYGLCTEACGDLQCLFFKLSTEFKDYTDAFWWQYGDLFTDISDAADIDLAFLSDQNTISVSGFQTGNGFTYSNVGRIGFALQVAEDDTVAITDLLGLDVTSTVFDTYYHTALGMRIFISKEYYAPGELYFKINL